MHDACHSGVQARYAYIRQVAGCFEDLDESEVAGRTSALLAYSSEKCFSWEGVQQVATSYVHVPLACSKRSMNYWIVNDASDRKQLAPALWVAISFPFTPVLKAFSSCFKPTIIFSEISEKKMENAQRYEKLLPTPLEKWKHKKTKNNKNKK